MANHAAAAASAAPRASPAGAHATQQPPAPRPSGPWLGLNGNSASNVLTHEWLGPLGEFSQYGAVYDRTFSITAGQLPSEMVAAPEGGSYYEAGLRFDHEAGMVPVVTILYRGAKGDLRPDPSFPTRTRTRLEESEGRTTISQYVDGFVRTAGAILQLVGERYPGMPVLFEAMNEPWAYTTPEYDGAEYAGVIAQLLPAVRRAGISSRDVYVSAYGTDFELLGGRVERYTPGWVPAMYAAQPRLREEIQGWYFHPYGPPSGTRFHDSEGIESVASVRRELSSGENNIIISELGFCTQQVGECSTGPAVQTSAEAAALLRATLYAALPYRRAGWLRALIVYSRFAGGWGMQEYPGGALTSSGEVFASFARTWGEVE